MNRLFSFPAILLIFILLIKCESAMIRGSMNDRSSKVILSLPEQDRLGALKILSNEAIEIGRSESIIQESNSLKHKQANLLNVPLWQILSGLAFLGLICFLLYLKKLKP